MQYEYAINNDVVDTQTLENSHMPPMHLFLIPQRVLDVLTPFQDSLYSGWDAWINGSLYEVRRCLR